MKEIILLLIILILIPIVIAAEEASVSIELELDKNTVKPGQRVTYQIALRNQLPETEYPVQLVVSLQGEEETKIYETLVYLRTSFTIQKNTVINKEIKPGNYTLEVKADYLGLETKTSAELRIEEPWYEKDVDKTIKTWHLIAISIIVIIILIIFRIRSNKN